MNIMVQCSQKVSYSSFILMFFFHLLSHNTMPLEILHVNTTRILFQWLTFSGYDLWQIYSGRDIDISNLKFPLTNVLKASKTNISYFPISLTIIKLDNLDIYNSVSFSKSKPQILTSILRRQSVQLHVYRKSKQRGWLKHGAPGGQGRRWDKKWGKK